MRKVKQLVERLPSLRYIILTDAAEHLSDKILSFSTLMEQASTDFKIPKQILKMLLYSILPVELPECQRRFTCASCCFTHYVTGKYVLDFHEGIGFGVLLIRLGNWTSYGHCTASLWRY
jgi:acetyl-CoA synthetase